LDLVRRGCGRFRSVTPPWSSYRLRRSARLHLHLDRSTRLTAGGGAGDTARSAVNDISIIVEDAGTFASTEFPCSVHSALSINETSIG